MHYAVCTNTYMNSCAWNVLDFDRIIKYCIVIETVAAATAADDDERSILF